MGKQKKEVVKKVEQKKQYGISLEVLIEQLKKKKEVKDTIETQYFQILGQIQLLKEQIEAIMKQNKK